MKILRTIIVLILSLSLLYSTTSCVVLTQNNHGKHKGWYKNSHNPHHPNSTNPGHKKQYKNDYKKHNPKSSKPVKSKGKHK